MTRIHAPAILTLALIAALQVHAWLPAALCAVPLAFLAGRVVEHRSDRRQVRRAL